MNLSNHDSTDELLKDIRKHEALIALSNDANFLLLIGEGYLKDELFNASKEFTSPNQDTVERAQMKITGVQLLREWLDTVSNTGENARNELGDRT